jgi:hypothetical protein
MADLKISQLPAATVPLAGTEVLPIVQSGTTKQVSVDNVVASRASLGANTFTAAQEWATGTAVASASTINLNATTGNRVHITGTTTITAVTLTRGPRTLIFDGVLTLTHNSTTNNLPGGVNITTAAGDRAIYESDGTTVYCVSYIKASGLPVVSGPGAALVLLSTVEAAASATVDIETTFNSTYDNYMIVASNIDSSSSQTVQGQFKLDGTYANSYDYHVTNQSDSSTAYSGLAAQAAASFVVVGDTDGDASSTAGFVMYIYKPSSTTIKKQATWTGGVMKNNAASSVVLNTGACGAVSNSALTGVRFFMAAGTITLGTFRLYGLANS